jgi:hypothetical protein
MAPTDDSKALYYAFLACLVVASLPIKNLAYVTPAIYLAIVWYYGDHRLIIRLVCLCSFVVVVSYIAIFWDHLNGRAVTQAALWLGLMTYAPLLVVLCETFDRSIDRATYDQFATVCVWFILFQSCIGLLQIAATGNPDAVCGTFGLLDGFRQSITIAQVYFTFTIFGMILFLIPVAYRWLPRVAIAAGAATCILAQSGHQLMFFVAALVLCGLVRVTHVGSLVRVVTAAVVMALLMLQFYPDTVWLTREWFNKLTDVSNSPKMMAIEGAAEIMQEPKNLLLGTGMGQYCSRAALIASNEYLSLRLPDFVTGQSGYFSDHIHPALLLFDEVGEGSAIVKPYMSAISLPVEFGLVLFTVFVTVIVRSAIWCARAMTGKSDELGWIGFSMMVGINFFAMCCLIENYAEFSQAVFVPFILFVVAGSRAETLQCAADAKLVKARIGMPYSLPRPRDFIGGSRLGAE